MKSLKHPILGDIVYGYRTMPLLPAVPDRVLLHSARLAFTHPITEEELDFEAPLPEAFQPFVSRHLEVG
jgi:23S rRNA pseudouridine1911/1915/1917 synthase